MGRRGPRAGARAGSRTGKRVRSRTCARGWCLSIALAGAAATAQASNGLNPIGVNATSVGLAGADTALAIDTGTINANPAGLARVGRRADLFGAAAYALDIRHGDQFGNDRGVQNTLAGFAGAAWSQPVAGTPLTWGIGLFYQGGTGNVFKDVRTAFGTTDQIAGLFNVVRVAPSATWRLDERWSVGATLGITHAAAEQRYFPGTSFSAGSTTFAGYSFRDVQDTIVIPKIGVLYEPRPDLRIGASWTERGRFDLRGHDMRVNFSALGAGTVSYRDVRLEGFALPRQADLGAFWQATPRVAFAARVSWLNWADALRKSTLTASGPDAAGVPATLSEQGSLDWRDQWVVALGAQWAVSDRLLVRAGVNHGRNPVPRATTSPLFAEIGEWHLTTGLEYALARRWSLGGALEYQLANRVRYTNPETPFGADAELTSRYVAIHLLLSRRFD